MEKARYQFLIINYYIVRKMRIYPLPHFQYYLPPRFFILSTDCFKFLLRRLQYPEEMKNKGYAFFFFRGGGLSKVHLRHYWEKKSVYVVVHFVCKVTFIFLLFLGQVC